MAIGAVASAEGQQRVAPGRAFEGELETTGRIDTFTFEAVSGTRVRVAVKGRKGLRPSVGLQDLRNGDLLERAGTGSSRARTALLTLDASGTYRVRVGGMNESTGTYKGVVKVKLDRGASRIRTGKSEPLMPGSALTFLAPRGATLSGSIKLLGASSPVSDWVELRAPSGTAIDLSPSSSLTRNGRTLKLKKLHLPETGTFTLRALPSGGEFSVKVRVTIPKIRGRAAILPSPFAPTLDPVSSETSERAIELRGTSLVAGARVEILHGQVLHTAFAGDDLRFSRVIALRSDFRNRFLVRELNAAGEPGPGVPLTVVQDSTGPNVAIDFPADGEAVTTASVTVVGRISDRLSGDLEMSLDVNGVVAEIDAGIGTNGTFEARNVPLTPNALNELVVTARDALGNERINSTYVLQLPADSAHVESRGGDGQSGVVRSVLETPLRVRVFDRGGAPYPGKVVHFAVVRSDGLLSAEPGSSGARDAYVTTDANGDAEVYWRLGSDAGCGNNRVRAEAESVPGSVVFCAGARAGDAAQLSLGSGSNQRVSPGTFALEPLRAWVNDGRNGCAGEAVVFELVRGEGYLLDESGVAGKMIELASVRSGHAEVQFVAASTTGTHIVEARLRDTDRRVRFALDVLESDAAESTSFEGVVLDSTQQPVGGALITLSVLGHLRSTFTSTTGQFQLPDLDPSGIGELVVEGSTATSVGGTPFPGLEAVSLPRLGFETLVVRGARNALPAPIVLPRVATSGPNVASFDNAEDVTLTLPGVEGLEFTFRSAPDARHTHPDGRPVTPADPITVSIHQVHSDEIPMVVPDGAAPPLAWTLQPVGAHFDPPVEVRYPNVGGLPPGSITYFLSFDHDTHRFEIVATGHVTDDGSESVTDAGGGISVAGWGGQCPPYPEPTEAESDPCRSAADALQKDYERLRDRNSGYAALANQIACLARKACGEFGPRPEWAQPPITNILQDLARARTEGGGGAADNLGIFPAGPAVEFICSNAPGDLGVPDDFFNQDAGLGIDDACSIMAGIGQHFVEELLPGFYKYAEQFKDDPNARRRHNDFIDQAVKGCFSEVPEFAESMQDLSALVVPTLAKSARETAIFVYCLRNGRLFKEGDDDPAPPLPSRSELFSNRLSQLGALRVQAASGDFFVTVGEPLDLRVTRGRNGTSLTRSPETTFAVLALPDSYTLDADGRLTVLSTSSATTSLPTVLYVIAKNGGDIGFGQFGVVGTDRDGDRIVDHCEMRFGLDPDVANALDADSDGDLLTDLEECVLGTHPLMFDTDGDGRGDGYEFEVDSDPRHRGIVAPSPDLDSVACVGGQTSPISGDGRFTATNLPTTGELIRARITTAKRTPDGELVTFYGRSDFFEPLAGMSVGTGNVEVSETPFPAIESLVVTAGTGGLQVIDQSGGLLQLATVATLADGTQQDVTQRADGTTYVASNPAIASVGVNGLVTAQADSGRCVISARHDGVTATTLVILAVGAPTTTLVGRVFDEAEQPVAGAEIRLFGTAVGLSNGAGAFSIPSVPADGELRASAVLGDLRARSRSVETVIDGLTDVGDLTLGPVTVEFDPELGTRPPELQVDDRASFIEFEGGFSFPYGGTLFDGIWVSTNGNVTFGGQVGDATFSPARPSGVVNNFPRISPAFFDLDPRTPADAEQLGGLYVKQEPNRFLVTWNRMREFSSGGDNTIQLVLHDDGSFLFVYNGLTATGLDHVISVASSPGGTPSVINVDYSNDDTLLSPDGATALIEDFDGQASPFDLDLGGLFWSPNGAGGYDVETVLGELGPAKGSSAVIGRLEGASLASGTVTIRSVKGAAFETVVSPDENGRFSVVGVPAPALLEIEWWTGDALLGRRRGVAGPTVDGVLRVLLQAHRTSEPKSR